jgi:hypothetical protein
MKDPNFLAASHVDDLPASAHLPKRKTPRKSPPHLPEDARRS